MVDYSLMIGSLPELARAGYQSGMYDQTADDISRYFGQQQAFTGGVGYMRNNDIRESELRKEFNAGTAQNILSTAGAGATFGSAFGPLGTAIGAVGGALVGGIGSIFRKNSMNKAIAEARDNNFRTDTVNEAVARSQAMRNDWNQSFLDTYNQVRHGADGIDKRSMDINAVMKPEEMIVDGNGNGEIPGGGVYGKDSVGVHVDDDTAILNDYFTAKALPSLMKQNYLKSLVNKNKGEAKDIAQRVVQKHLNDSRDELLAVADEQKAAREAGLIPRGDNDMPIHAAAGWDSIAVNGLSGLVGLGQFIGAHGSRIKNPYTYMRNPYAQQAFDTFDRQNIPLLPITNQLKDDRAKGIQQIANSGGLSSSQKLAGYAATTSNTQTNTAKMMFDYYRQLNDIKAKAAQLKLSEGQHAAQMMQNAAQWDLDYYSKAHAARQDMMNMGLYNTVGALRDIVKNADRNRMFNLMEKMYVDNGEGVEHVKYDNPFNTKKANTNSLASISNANPSSDATRLLGLTKRKNTLGVKSPTLSVPYIPTNINDLYLKVANDATDRLYKRLFG